MNIRIFVKPGTAITRVDMMPMRAYAKAQNGKASGSLQKSKETCIHLMDITLQSHDRHCSDSTATTSSA